MQERIPYITAQCMFISSKWLKPYAARNARSASPSLRLQLRKRKMLSCTNVVAILYYWLWCFSYSKKCVYSFAASQLVNKTHHVLFLKLIISTLCAENNGCTVLLFFFFCLSCVCKCFPFFSSQLISGLFARPCMPRQNKEDLERHGDDIKERLGGGRARKRERDRLISDLKWQFVVTFCQRNTTLMKKCINKGCREDIRLLQVNGRDRGRRRRDGGGVETRRERVNRLDISGYIPLAITDSGSDFTCH